MLEEKIKELAMLRKDFEKAKGVFHLKMEDVTQSDEAKTFDELRWKLEMFESEIRKEALKLFTETGEKKPHEAVEIKERTNLVIDEVKAFEYAKYNLPDALTVNRKIFDKVMKALPEESLPDGVKIEKVPSAYISTDLSKFLE